MDHNVERNKSSSLIHCASTVYIIYDWFIRAVSFKSP